MEQREQPDELYLTSRIPVWEIIWNYDFYVEFARKKANLDKKKWKHKYYDLDITKISTSKLIKLYTELIKDNTMLFRDEWRQLIKEELNIKLDLGRRETFSSKMNEK